MEFGTPVVASWERTLYAGLTQWVPAWGVRALTAINALAWEPLWLSASMLAAYWEPAWALSIWASRGLETWAKPLAHRWSPRGRPRDPHEHGLPSGDVMLITAALLPWLGWYAVPIIALIAWARLVRRAHWPLDVLAGAALGALLAASWRLYALYL